MKKKIIEPTIKDLRKDVKAAEDRFTITVRKLITDYPEVKGIGMFWSSVNKKVEITITV